MSLDLHVVIQWGELKTAVVQEGCAGNPDVTEDTVQRCIGMFVHALNAADALGLLGQDLEDDDDDDDDPDTDTEPAT